MHHSSSTKADGLGGLPPNHSLPIDAHLNQDEIAIADRHYVAISGSPSSLV